MNQEEIRNKLIELVKEIIADKTVGNAITSAYKGEHEEMKKSFDQLIDAKTALGNELIAVVEELK